MTGGPLVSIDAVEVGPVDLQEQLPVVVRLRRFLPGPDRPDYTLAVARRPVRVRSTLAHLVAEGVDLSGADPLLVRYGPDGSVEADVHGLVLAPRVQGTPFTSDMRDLPVAMAYVLDPSQMTAPAVDLTKIYYAAVVLVSGIPTTSPEETGRPTYM
ncbi:hypothetical protein [Sanguibacter suaedae]|uniref:Uncharacterized protein n=1 Tax=Sanguibacter suaedae TaxID=2795737 RepID=A0A934MDR5_9MICO|nr:hypothetical protein [Sanguibacter suaedae]MBI9115034.1 hypothetical protein [Sanguibacter suaedae]